MVKIRLRNTRDVLVGLHRVGITGLDQAFSRADDSDLSGREELVDLMMPVVAALTYIPPSVVTEYRQAVWREYLRHRGEDIRHLFSEIEIVLREEPGPGVDRFLEILEEVFAKFELKPVIAVEPPDPKGPNPQVLISNEVVVAGTTDSKRIAQAVGRQISDW